MGRSVSTPSAATLIAHGCIDEDDDLTMFVDDMRDQLADAFPSVHGANYWIGNEDHAVAENGHATFGISHYWGVLSYWAVPKTDLGATWLRSIAPRFNKLFNQLESLGTASNGETFYRRIK